MYISFDTKTGYNDVVTSIEPVVHAYVHALYVNVCVCFNQLNYTVNKAIRDGRPRPPRHQGFSAISYGGSELRHRSILETITHRPKCQIQKL